MPLGICVTLCVSVRVCSLKQDLSYQHQAWLTYGSTSACTDLRSKSQRSHGVGMHVDMTAWVSSFVNRYLTARGLHRAVCHFLTYHFTGIYHFSGTGCAIDQL